jgi:P-type conjugative transfer protein TrbG
MKRLFPFLLAALVAGPAGARPPMPSEMTPPTLTTTPPPMKSKQAGKVIEIAVPSADDLVTRSPPPLRAARVPPDSTSAVFDEANPVLTLRERDALALSKRWQDGGPTSSNMIATSDGTVRYVFGASYPSIVCAVLQVCAVELQAGERVSSLNAGDTARWIIEPGVTGSGDSEVQHVIIKPTDVGLETSLIVMTNRRTYYLRLRSHRTEYMPRIAFSYPEEAAAKWELLRTREAKERKEATIPSTGEYMGDLNFDYTVTGDARWKPMRVYNDGRKTMIQMPPSMSQSDAPTLLVVRKEGGIFTDEETVMVNYRVQADRFIVDSVFDRAILISGVGSSQDRVTIQRGK